MAMRAIELFSCSGGMAEGFRRAGIEFLAAYDKSPDACASYAHNLGRDPVQEDIHNLLVRVHEEGFSHGSLDLLVADPPCTPWSRAGKRRGIEDERDCLKAVRDLILAWRPRAYLIGNVPGLDDAKHQPTVQALFAPLVRAGYCVADYVRLDAADYGTPQHRKRPFWFGHLGGPCITWPRPTHSDPRVLVTGSLFEAERLAPWVTVRQALALLPRHEWGVPMRDYRANRKHPPSRLDTPSHTVSAKQRDVLSWPWSRPATTVCCDQRLAPPGHHGGTGYHSSPNAIRLSEAAAAVLQGFPPSWVFCGKSRRARWQQIGQAMPPGLAAAVARSVSDWFSSAPTRTGECGR